MSLNWISEQAGLIELYDGDEHTGIEIMHEPAAGWVVYDVNYRAVQDTEQAATWFALARWRRTCGEGR